MLGLRWLLESQVGGFNNLEFSEKNQTRDIYLEIINANVKVLSGSGHQEYKGRWRGDLL